MHVRQAEVQLGSRIQWLADAMTNELKHALGDMPNSEFTIDTRRSCGRTSGMERSERTTTGLGASDRTCREPDPSVGPRPRHQTGGADSSQRYRAARRAARPHGNAAGRADARRDGLSLLYELRADVEPQFLRTGEGTLYLGFHIDPLYHMHWNNEAPPLDYEVTAAAGVQVTPAAAAFVVVAEPADADPGSSCSTSAQTTGANRWICASLTTRAMTRTPSASQ